MREKKGSVGILEPEKAEQTPGALANGTVVDGKFEITGFIGAGGMGTVYRARHIELGSAVALKTLQPRFFADEDASSRFRREAKIIAGLHHKNILAVHASGESNNLLYMAMELIEGKSLDRLVAEEGSLTTSEALPLLIQICDAMIYAHANKVLHRDLKPENVLIETRGTEQSAKVVDFGLAKLTDLEMQRLTQTGMVVGDPHYMSPEQAQGRQADERSDIYSFGCLMYCILSGAPPFQSDSDVAVLFKQVSDEPQPFANAKSTNCLRSCQSICFQAMEKKPDKRYQSFQELSDELKKLESNPDAKTSGSPRAASPASFGNMKVHFVLAITAAACVLLLVCVMAPKLLRHDQLAKDQPANNQPANDQLPDKTDPQTYAEAYKHLAQRDAKLRVKELLSVLAHAHPAPEEKKAILAELKIAEHRIGFDPVLRGNLEYERANALTHAAMQNKASAVQGTFAVDTEDGRQAMKHLRKSLDYFSQLIELYRNRPTVSDTEFKDIEEATIGQYRSYDLLMQIANTMHEYKVAKRAAKECIEICEYTQVPPKALAPCKLAFDTLILIHVQDIDYASAENCAYRKLAFLKRQKLDKTYIELEQKQLEEMTKSWPKQKHHPN